MLVNCSFLITDGKSLILTSQEWLPPTIAVEENIGESCKKYMFEEFSIVGDYANAIKLLSYMEKNGELFLFKGVVVPETFPLTDQFDWFHIHSLHNSIKDNKLYYMIMSFLNSI